MKLGRFGAILSNDIFVFMVSKFYDFGERVIFGSGDGLKVLILQGIWEIFEVGKWVIYSIYFLLKLMIFE